jgi:acetolactate synthase I/II/III large subunit
MKLSDYVLEELVRAGARHVFLVPGGAAMHLNNSILTTKGLGWTAHLHEQAATTAAECWAKQANALGVAMVTAGPGSTNALTGVASAWVNSVPMVVLAGQVKSADLKRGAIRQNGLQEVDSVAIARPITKLAVTIEPDRVRAQVEEAIHLAKSGRPGPVWLTIPQDVQGMTIDPASQPGFTPPPRPKSDLTADVTRIIEALNRSERPVILAGAGIRLSGALDRALELFDVLGVPIQTTWAAIDILPDDHPLYAGRPGAFATRGANFTIQNSDFMLALGTRLDFATTGFSRERFARGATRIVVDVDPAEIDKFGSEIAIKVCADAGDVVDALLARRDEIQKKPRADWMKRIREWRDRYPVVAPEPRDRERETSMYVLTEKLGELLGEDAVIVEGSSGVHAEIFFLAYKTKKGQRVQVDGSFGAMGYGLPASIGACIGAGRRPTVLVEGDGSLQPHLQELQTIAREKLPLKIIILNNGGYASIRVSQRRYFGQLIAADPSSGLTFPPLDKIADAHGIAYTRIGGEHELVPKLTKALASSAREHRPRDHRGHGPRRGGPRPPTSERAESKRPNGLEAARRPLPVPRAGRVPRQHDHRADRRRLRTED